MTYSGWTENNLEGGSRNQIPESLKFLFPDYF
jgi:hypothetical protein